MPSSNYDVKILKNVTRSAAGKTMITSIIHDLEVQVNDTKLSARIVIAYKPNQKNVFASEICRKVYLDKTIKRSKETYEIKEQILKAFMEGRYVRQAFT